MASPSTTSSTVGMMRHWMPFCVAKRMRRFSSPCASLSVGKRRASARLWIRVFSISSSSFGLKTGRPSIVRPSASGSRKPITL